MPAPLLFVSSAKMPARSVFHKYGVPPPFAMLSIFARLTDSKASCSELMLYRRFQRAAQISLFLQFPIPAFHILRTMTARNT